MTWNMQERVLGPELMDQPGLDPSLHRQALRGLRRVNRLSATAGVLWRELARLGPPAAGRPLQVLDLACGGGDVLIELARRAARQNVPIAFLGRDINATAIMHARELAGRCRLAHVRFEQADALNGELGPGRFDAVYCTLFLHHLDRAQAVLLLKRMAMLARQRVLVDDLRRTRLGYLMAWAGCRLLSRSPIVRVDGPLSVRSAFTEHEAIELAEEAGLSPVQVRRHWPQRYLLSWQRVYTSRGPN